MASRRNKGRAGRKLPGELPETTAPRIPPLQFEVTGPRPEAESRSVTADEASLWEEFRADPRGVARRIAAAQDRAFVPALTSCLERGAMVLHAMARAQLRFADDHQPTARAHSILSGTTGEVTDRELPSSALGSLGPRADISDAEYNDCIERFETDDIEPLRRAFYADLSIVGTIAAVAAARPGLARAVASNLDVLLEDEALVRLCMAYALARIATEPEQRSAAVAIALDAAAALTNPPSAQSSAVAEAIEPLIHVAPRAVIPRLAAFLRGIPDREHRGMLLKAVDSLIPRGFAIPDGDPEDGRALTFALLGELLKGEAVAKSLVEQVAQIVRARTLGEGFESVIKELADAAGVGVERIGWSIWGELLTSPNEAERGRVDPEAALWAIGNLSGAEGPPWTWRVYDHIARFLRDREPECRAARLKAIWRLGAYGPTSIRDPLPDDVKELRAALAWLKKDPDPQVRRAAAAALARNRARGEVAVRETRVLICTIARDPSAALPGERIAPLVEPPELSIHSILTIVPTSGETSYVASMDATQGGPRDPTAAPPRDLDLLSHRVTTNDAREGFSPARSVVAATTVHADRLDLATLSFTTIDPAVLHIRTLLVSDLDGNERPVSRDELDAHGHRERSEGGGPPKPSIAEDIWALIHDIDAELTPTRAAILPKLQSLLTMLAQIGTLGTFEANDKVVRKLYEYLGVCKQQLTYTDAERNLRDVPVTVDCLDLADYKAGAIRIYRGNHGKAITQKSRFPSFGLMPIAESSAESASPPPPPPAPG